MAMLGNAIGFPLLLAYALRVVSASHAAVITALLPLVTAACAAWVLHQRARLGFWLCALAGSALVIVFSLLRAGARRRLRLRLGRPAAGRRGVRRLARLHLRRAGHAGAGRRARDLLGLRDGAAGHAAGRAAGCGREQPVAASSWVGFVYVGVFSMWVGFFAWYRGLAMGGALRVSQTQLLQPFLSILAAVPLLGEPLDLVTLGFAAAVVATVVAGKKLSQPRAPAARMASR